MVDGCLTKMATAAFSHCKGERGVLLMHRLNCPFAYCSLILSDQLDYYTTTEHALLLDLFFSGIEMSF